MKRICVSMEVLTPCFCAGADQSRAEIQAPSIRGQLRWWFRVLNNHDTAFERAVFGGVHKPARASSLVTRVRNAPQKSAKKNLDDFGYKPGRDPQAYFLWPLRPTRQEPDLGRGVIETEGNSATFDLELLHRRINQGRTIPEATLKAFCYLGALGTRSRRGYGSLWPSAIKIDGVAQPIPDNETELGRELQSILKGTNIRVLALDRTQSSASAALDICADFLQTFRCGSSAFGQRPSPWGKNDHDVGLRGNGTVYRPVIGLPLTQRYRNARRTIESGHGPKDEHRWASPVLLKVVRSGGGFLPISVFVPDMALPDGEKIHLREKRGRGGSATTSRELLEAMMEPDSRFWSSATRLA